MSSSCAIMSSLDIWVGSGDVSRRLIVGLVHDVAHSLAEPKMPNPENLQHNIKADVVRFIEQVQYTLQHSRPFSSTPHSTNES
jgi:hypothetical protein